MKTLRYSLPILTILLSTSVYQAQAQSTFVVQLGTFDNEAKAKEKWESIKSSHSNLVGTLSHQVTEVTLPPDNYTVYRTQAGPLTSRDAAQTLCGKLVADKLECTVVETAMFTPETTPAETKTALAPLPNVADKADVKADMPAALPAATSATAAMAEKTPAADTTTAATPMAEPLPTAKEEKTSSLKKIIFPWLNDDEAPAEAPRINEAPAAAPVETVAAAPAPAATPAAPVAEVISSPAPVIVAATAPTQPSPAPSAPKELMVPKAPEAAAGDVQVAEAIRVPVTTSGTLGMAPPSAGQRITLRDTLPYRTYPSQNLHQRTFWARLSFFSNGQEALGYWNQLRNAHSEFAGQLRARVTSPLATRGRAAASSLQIGPFSTADGAQQLCGITVPDGVRCTVSADLGTSTTANVPRSNTRTRSYQQRRMNNMAAHSPSINLSNGGMFWVMLGSYGSQGEAENAWEGMQGAQRDLLGRYKSSIATPMMGSSAQGMYRLRTGPFIGAENANQLCDSLRWRGVQCLVLNDR